ncbi:MAG: branched-chain amino acid ABC transporter permease [Archaeoglobaceae archaeon]
MDILVNIALWFGLYAVVALSLNVEYGYAGIPNFGRALAVLVGAVVVGGLMNRVFAALLGVSGKDIIELSSAVSSELNEIIAANPAFGIFLLLFYVLAAALIGAAVGALVILPSARLREDYLAITLLAISEVFFMVCNYNVDIIGGYYGVSTPDVLAFAAGAARQSYFAAITLTIAAAVYLIVERLTNSPFGRTLRALRENEDVLKSVGKSVMVLRIKASVVGSAVAAISGALFSLFSANVIATSFSRVEWTFYPFLMVLLGGAGNNRGVIVGSLTFAVVKITLTTYKFEVAELLANVIDPVWLEYIMFGLLMYFVLLYKPEGLIREKPIFTKAIRLVASKARRGAAAGGR